MLVGFVDVSLASLYIILCAMCMHSTGGGYFEGAIVCEFDCYIVAMYACVNLDFMYYEFTWELCDEVNYKGDEEFIWVVVLGGWFSDVIVEHVYIIKAIMKHVDVM